MSVIKLRPDGRIKGAGRFSFSAGVGVGRRSQHERKHHTLFSRGRNTPDRSTYSHTNGLDGKKGDEGSARLVRKRRQLASGRLSRHRRFSFSTARYLYKHAAAAV